MKPIKVAMIGVGNCASSLVQGVAYYRQNNSSQGLIHDKIGGYGAGDVDFVLGIDVDARKVGKDIAEAIFAQPNNTKVFHQDVPMTGNKVIMGLISDGVAPHMTTVGEKGFIVSDAAEATRESIVKAIKDSGAEVLINFLPVGSQLATEFYMECALEAGVAVVNCMPVFIASRPEWEKRFRDANLPIVGDDIKAQVGATIVHRVLSSLFAARGVTVERTYQLNTGGNTDFRTCSIVSGSAPRRNRRPKRFRQCWPSAWPMKTSTSARRTMCHGKRTTSCASCASKGCSGAMSRWNWNCACRLKTARTLQPA